jgi:hypothetical protein
MSDTPRTKAATRMAFSGEYMVPIQDAQKIERELAQSKEANAGLMRACENLERKLAEVTEQRDALANAGNQLLDSVYSQDWRKLPAIRNMRKALAATKGGEA